MPHQRVGHQHGRFFAKVGQRRDQANDCHTDQHPGQRPDRRAGVGGKQRAVRKLVEDLPDEDPRHQRPQIEADNTQRAEDVEPWSKGDQARDVPPGRSDCGWSRWCVHTGSMILMPKHAALDKAPGDFTVA